MARYLASVLGEWARTDLPFGRVTLFSPEPLPDGVLPAEHPFDVHVLPAASARLWGQWQLPRAARGVDLLFCPAYVAPAVYGGRYVVVMHDALLEVLPQAFSRQVLRRNLFRRSACHAARVLTPSEASRRDLVRVYGLDPGRVRAIHLGVEDRFAGASEEDATRVRQRYSLGTSPIVLFVGKLSQRRNLPNLVRAVAALRARHGARHLLVLAGENYLDLRLEDLARELGAGEALRILGFVPDEDLPGLYRAAETFVYPSEYEGFGIPVLEAMAAGTPAVTLDNSSLSEVAGDAAVLLRTADVEELAGALERLAADPGLRDEYGERGRARAKQFTWAATARKTADALVDAAA